MVHATVAPLCTKMRQKERFGANYKGSCNCIIFSSATDPPYNTGQDFVYKDDFKDNIQNYLEITGQTDESGKKLGTNTESNGRFHTDWLNMMYPRLRLARNLLSDDGVIFISIDEGEHDNIIKTCNEIFGESNFVADLIWKRKRGRDNSAKWFSKAHEYCVLFAKQKDMFNTGYLELDEETKKAYKNPDNDPRGNYRMLGCWARGTQGGVKYDYTSNSGQYFAERLWLFSKENLKKLDDDKKLIIRGDNIYRKMFIYENKGKIPETLWDDVSNAANASDEIKRLFEKIIFDTPKPIPYIRRMIDISCKKNSIILDFFSGSATTAHAVMQLNAEDGGNRKFICVQLPEPTDEKSEAYKAGYKNICEIGKERIRRAGEQIKQNRADKNDDQLSIVDSEAPQSSCHADLDVGFKVFKLNSSNINRWNPDFDSVADLSNYINNAVDNFAEGRTELDIVYEIMIKYGIDLTYAVETMDAHGTTLYSIGGGMLIICLSNNITKEIADYIAEFKRDEDIEGMRVVFKDNGFADDSTKTNVWQILQTAGVEEFVTI